MACKKALFSELDSAECEGVTEVESLCTNCERNGTTRLLLTKIPMFREVILMSFSCPHCGNENSEIQPGAPIQDHGVQYTLLVNRREVLDRTIVKADSAYVKVPELNFEIPPSTQKGVITTVEGLLLKSVEDLLKEQPVRKAVDPNLAVKLDDFIDKLQMFLQGTSPFTFILDDPCGNSFIENPFAPNSDPLLSVDHYTRTEKQDKELGIQTDHLNADASDNECSHKVDEPIADDEVLVFHTNCPYCNSASDTRMKTLDIPNFKQVIIMATTCEYCGHRTNEVKSGAGISENGLRIVLKLSDANDLNRDILKAETASVTIPELDFELETGTLGGRFTTIEGLLKQIKEQLKKAYPASAGDSSVGSKLQKFFDTLDEVICGRLLNVHLILDDPAGNSYIQNVFAPEEDPNMKIEHYKRTFEQNEALGLNDMKTDN